MAQLNPLHWNWSLIIYYSGALLTPVIAGIAVMIAWRQWKTASVRLAFDLFDRRFALFIEFEGLFRAVKWRRFDDLNAMIGRFDAIATETRYLFGGEVAEFVDEVQRKAVEVHSALTFLNDDNLPVETRKESAQDQLKITHWVTANEKRIRELFDDKLSLAMIK